MKTWRVRPAADDRSVGDALVRATRLSLDALGDAAKKGALWLQRGKGKVLRERTLGAPVTPQDTLTLYYDARVLALPPLTEAQCLFENERYGIWIKEAGVLPQGTQTGDHVSLLHYIESKKKKEIHLIHRLDRETAGLMLFAYDAAAAAKLGDLFQKNLIKKEYEAIVLGTFSPGHRQTIDVSLEDKRAITRFEAMDSKGGRSLLKITIETGRLHQIRRHLDHIGHPVMGDPKYGKGNKNREGLKLLARVLSFEDPWTRKTVSYSTPNGLTL